MKGYCECAESPSSYWSVVYMCGLCSKCKRPVKPMTPTEDPRTALTKLHEDLCNEARELSARKNQDYAAGEDPFANFRLCADMSLCSATTGVLVRLSDKMRRLASLESQEAQVLDESRRDTILDIINYAVILAALYSEPIGQE